MSVAAEQVYRTASSRTVVDDTLADLGAQNPRLWVVTPDIAGNLGRFRQAFPDRFMDVGLAEQAAVGIAAGLAYAGNTAVVSGMLPFLSMRALEQVRTDVCYPNLPVTIVGTHGGLVGNGGSTHYAMEDLGIMTSLVNMTVLSVGDPMMVGPVLRMALAVDGPVYLRLGAGKADPVVYGSTVAAPLPDEDLEIGRGIIAREGSDLTLFTHGVTLHPALEAARLAEHRHGISTRVVDMFTIKPLDTELVGRCAAETGRFIVLEDHVSQGGLASGIADVMADQALDVKAFRRLGIPQLFPGFGLEHELRDKHGYGVESTVAAIRRQAG